MLDVLLKKPACQGVKVKDNSFSTMSIFNQLILS